MSLSILICKTGKLYFVESKMLLTVTHHLISYIVEKEENSAIKHTCFLNAENYFILLKELLENYSDDFHHG